MQFSFFENTLARIGSAVRVALEKEGHRVIGVDLRDADGITDLSTPAGRAEMVAAVAEASGGAFDGLVAGAGVAPQGGAPDQSSLSDGFTVSVNYFGAVATLAGLRPLLAGAPAPRAVAIASNAPTTQAGIPIDVADLCLAATTPDAKAKAVAAADKHPGFGYGISRLALARWVRRNATTPEWAGEGICFNAVCPGITDTPMVSGVIDHIRAGMPQFPLPLGRTGEPHEIAALIAFLLSLETSFCVGSTFFVDGGTDAALRADDWPVPTAV
jgi:NAD(P)-dependent dehydrogenase (short-subunit alcohol dehydrogenase family)